MEAELKLPGGGSKLVVVAGQPLDINEDDCMLFTLPISNPGARRNRRCGKVKSGSPRHFA